MLLNRVRTAAGAHLQFTFVRARNESRLGQRIQHLAIGIDALQQLVRVVADHFPQLLPVTSAVRLGTHL